MANKLSGVEACSELFGEKRFVYGKYACDLEESTAPENGEKPKEAEAGVIKKVSCVSACLRHDSARV